MNLTAGWRLYANTPGRAALQAVADFIAIMWLVLCYAVGRLVYKALEAIARVGHGVKNGADGISSNLNQAGSKVDGVPLVGDKLRTPFSAAGSAAHQIAAAGQGLDDKARLLAIVLSLAVAIPPALMVAVPWLLLRVRFMRRAASTTRLAIQPGGERLLALRAIVNRPLSLVSAAVPGEDPLEAWRREDPAVMHQLAALELRRAGLRVPRSWRNSVTSGPPEITGGSAGGG